MVEAQHCRTLLEVRPSGLLPFRAASASIELPIDLNRGISVVVNLCFILQYFGSDVDTAGHKIEYRLPSKIGSQAESYVPTAAVDKFSYRLRMRFELIPSFVKICEIILSLLCLLKVKTRYVLIIGIGNTDLVLQDMRRDWL